MAARGITRRRVLRAGFSAGMATAAMAFHGPWRLNTAFAQSKPIKLGLTSDASGQYGDCGQDELRGIRMAIDEANARGGVLGRPITWVTADTETTPETGRRVAERFIAEDCTILIGGIHSDVAHAITRVTAPKGVIYFNTNSSAASESRENCSRTKFVWDGSGANFAKATVMSAIESIGTSWVLLTHDYVWGHSAAAATRALILATGGRVMANVLVPQDADDFTPYLRRIEQLNPDVVATAIGGDSFKALRRQVVARGMDNKPAWISSQQDWPDIWGARDSVFGVFGTTWYHKLPLAGVADFVRRWQAANRDGPIPVPGNVSYNGYMATRELLAAMVRTGSTNNIRIIKELEALKVPARDRMQHFDAHMNPRTHQMQQTIYLARRNPRPSDDTDLFEIMSWKAPETVQDPAGPDLCSLVPYERVPVVDS